jgi:hypothetical protein
MFVMGTSKNGAGSGWMTMVPSEVKKTATCCCAPRAIGWSGKPGVERVRKVCGFFRTVGGFGEEQVVPEEHGLIREITRPQQRPRRGVRDDLIVLRQPHNDRFRWHARQRRPVQVRGIFSKKCGAPWLTPSICMIPGVLSDDGTRAVSKLPISGRKETPISCHSMEDPPATLRTPARTCGSTARKIVPIIPPIDWPK